MESSHDLIERESEPSHWSLRSQKQKSVLDGSLFWPRHSAGAKVSGNRQITPHQPSIHTRDGTSGVVPADEAAEVAIASTDARELTSLPAAGGLAAAVAGSGLVAGASGGGNKDDGDVEEDAEAFARGEVIWSAELAAEGPAEEERGSEAAAEGLVARATFLPERFLGCGAETGVEAFGSDASADEGRADVVEAARRDAREVLLCDHALTAGSCGGGDADTVRLTFAVAGRAAGL